MTDVFLDIDGQPNESLSIISERLEARSLSGQFQEFTKKFPIYLKLKLYLKIY